MSTELYFQIERRSPDVRRWRHFARIRVSNDYLLFALLAGARTGSLVDVPAECLAPKGIPEDVTDLSLREDSLTIDDEAAKLEIAGTCTRTDAGDWVNKGYSRYLQSGYAVTHPNNFAYSWVSVDELRLVRERYRSTDGHQGLPALNSVIATMESLANDAFASRAVFWFAD